MVKYLYLLHLNRPEPSLAHFPVEDEQVGAVQVRLERVWGILQMPVTAKLDWVIRYTGPEAADMFEPALQAFEQAAAAVLERERYHSSIPFAARLSLLIALLLPHFLLHSATSLKC